MAIMQSRKILDENKKIKLKKMKIKQIVILLIVTILSLTSCKLKKNNEKLKVKSNSEVKNVKVTEIKNEKKIIALMVRAGGCAFELKINGTVVLNEEVGSSFYTSFGIEHHLEEGENEVKVTIRHSKNETSNFLAKIVLLDPQTEEDSWKLFGKIESNEKNKVTTHSLKFKPDSTFQKKVKKKKTALYYRAKNCDIEISVNDILITKKRLKNNNTTRSLPMGQYVVNGENSIKIKVIPLENKHLYLDVKLASHGTDSQSFFDESSWNYHLVIDAEELSTAKVYEKKFNISEDYKMTWETAPKIELNKKNIKKIDAFVKKVYKAFKNKKGEDISYLYKYIHQDLHTINSKYDIKVWKSIHIESINNRKDPLIKLKKGKYTLEADGRLVSCVGEDNLPLIRCLEVDGYAWGEKMRIGLIDGEFYILLQ